MEDYGRFLDIASEVRRCINDLVDNIKVEDKFKPCIEAYLFNGIIVPIYWSIFKDKGIKIDRIIKKVSRVVSYSNRRKRLVEVCNLYMTILSGKPYRIVDIGCGLGRNLNIISNYLGSKPDYIGIDKDLDKLRAMKTLYNGFEAIQADASAIPLRSKSIDIVTCTNVLHELPNLKVIEEVYNILRPGGYLFIADIIVRYIPYKLLNLVRRLRMIFKMRPETPYTLDQISLKINSFRFNTIVDRVWWRGSILGVKVLVARKY